MRTAAEEVIARLQRGEAHARKAARIGRAARAAVRAYCHRHQDERALDDAMAALQKALRAKA